mmetsp:Transcript_115139/g.326197  ORF Transcript_115139/g.326197 Transcript_115139/m.326197 type:complete len:263 (+) Transcript_115139:975-1763(+)
MSTCSSVGTSCTCCCCQSTATLNFLRFWISPSGHRWQWRHSRPFSQPCGFQNQAQGLHRPVPCVVEPMDGGKPTPGGSTTPGKKGLPPGGTTRAAPASFCCWGGWAAPRWPVPLGVPPPPGCFSWDSSCVFTFFLALISPSGQRWQCRHASPFPHPWGFQNHAHGRHSPVPCLADPTHGTSGIGSFLPCCSSPGCLPAGGAGVSPHSPPLSASGADTSATSCFCAWTGAEPPPRAAAALALSCSPGGGSPGGGGMDVGAPAC